MVDLTFLSSANIVSRRDSMLATAPCSKEPHFDMLDEWSSASITSDAQNASKCCCQKAASSEASTLVQMQRPYTVIVVLYPPTRAEGGAAFRRRWDGGWRIVAPLTRSITLHQSTCRHKTLSLAFNNKVLLTKGTVNDGSGITQAMYGSRFLTFENHT